MALQEWERHVIDVRTSNERRDPGYPSKKIAYCGAEVDKWDKPFLDATHAISTIQAGSILLPCPECAKKIIAILDHGADQYVDMSKYSGVPEGMVGRVVYIDMSTGGTLWIDSRCVKWKDENITPKDICHVWGLGDRAVNSSRVVIIGKEHVSIPGEPCPHCGVTTFPQSK